MPKTCLLENSQSSVNDARTNSHAWSTLLGKKENCAYTSSVSQGDKPSSKAQTLGHFLCDFPCPSVIPSTLYSQLPKLVALPTVYPGHLMTILSLSLPALVSLTPSRTVCRVPLLPVPLVPAWGLGTHCVLPRRWQN